MPRLSLGRVDRFDIVLIGTVLILGGATATMLAFPAIQARVVSPALDLSLDTVAVVVTSLLTVLTWIRYSEQHEPFALFQSAAFLVLAIANMHAVLGTIGVDLAAPLLATEPGQDELYVFTVARMLAGALLVIGGVSSLRGWKPSHPRLIVLGPASVTIGAVVWLSTAEASLPALIGPIMPSVGALPQPAPLVTPIGVGIQLMMVALFSAVAVVCRELWRRDRSIADAYVTLGLVLVAFAQLHDAISPGTHPGPVTTGDLLRLGFVIALLLAVEAEARFVLNSVQRSNQALEQLRDSEVERAALEERAWLSRELHDGLSQDLWLAKLRIAPLAAMKLTPEVRGIVEEVSGAIELGLTEARQAVMALRVAPESEDSFADLMAHYVDDFQDRFGLRVEFDCTGDLPTMPVRMQAELLRIAQEALANARRHADATVVRIQAAGQDGRIRMSVVDNGCGFDRAAVGANTYGLTAMRERAALIGAELEIRSAPGEGTRVQVLAPLHAPTMRAALEMT